MTMLKHEPRSFTLQRTKALHLQRVANGWLVWLAGSPHTPHHTYLYLYDNGQIERVTEGPHGEIDILTIPEGT
jgi:hypothetical protein